MRDQATTLQVLIGAAEAVLTLRHAGDAAYLDDLASDVIAWESKPAPDGRCIHAYTRMAIAAVAMSAQAIRTHGAEHAQPYLRIIGTLLPDIRRDYLTAIEQRKRPTA